MLYTASLNRREDHHGTVLDVTVKSARPEDACLAPTWALVLGVKDGTLSWTEYADRYTQLLRVRWNTVPAARRRMEQLAQQAALGDVTLCCYCREPQRCHRSLLAGILTRIADARDLQLQLAVR
jgi:uncharacterized protein YeaO (DUF488 family)